MKKAKLLNIYQLFVDFQMTVTRNSCFFETKVTHNSPPRSISKFN